MRAAVMRDAYLLEPVPEKQYGTMTNSSPGWERGKSAKGDVKNEEGKKNSKGGVKNEDGKRTSNSSAKWQ